MYITPNSTIKLLSGVPLNNSYEHTIFFSSVTDQYNYFNSVTSKAFSNESYTRHSNNQIKLAVRCDHILNYNYMMFQNTNYGSKWFYAFILDSEYVSNDVSLITYELDVMQSYFFTYTLKQCYVDREHSATDTVGSNTVPEPVELGNYYRHVNESAFNVTANNILISVTRLRPTQVGEAGEPARPDFINGVFTGLGYYTIPNVNTTNGLNAAKALVQLYITSGQEDSIVNIVQYPSFIVAQNSVTKINYSVNITYGNFDGYTPKNKKLYTYPYQFLTCTNQMGTIAEFAFENFSNSSAINFEIYGSILPNPEVVCVPRNYLGIYEDFSNAINITDFPTCAWSGDSYKQYLALNRNSMIYNNITTAVGSVTNAVSQTVAGNPIGGALSLASGASNFIGEYAKLRDIENAPNHAHGKNSGAVILNGTHNLGFVFYRSHIKNEYARQIDEFFTRYGYKTNRLKIPNRNVRPHWTYTKTVNCCITGGVPTKYAEKIISIYNNGVTFWKNPTEVGNFSLNNSI